MDRPYNQHELLLTPMVLLFVMSFLLKFILDGRKQMYRLPPSPPKLPIIGNLHQFGKLPHQSLWKMSQKYGPLMFLRLGSTPAVVVSSAEMAKQVIKMHDLDTCGRPPSPGPKKLSYNNLDVFFSPYNEYWREMRKIFTLELLSMKKVRSFRHIRESEVDNLMVTLTRNTTKVVNLSEVILSLVDGIMANVAFGKISGTKHFTNEKLRSVLSEVNTLSVFMMEDFFPRWGHAIDKLMGQSARLQKCFKDLDGYFQFMLDEHRNPSFPISENIVTFLLSLRSDPENELSLSNDHIKAVLGDIFIGGIGSIDNTVVWAMTELIRKPRLLRKVQTEIRTLVGKKAKVDEDDLENLKYLKCVVKETLRLHPPATLLIPRETIRHCKIGGYDVFPKTRVFINVWGMGRDPKSWENAEEFNPDRFEGSEVNFRGQSFEFLPFGGGRRICPGMAMSVITVEYTLANLLYGFDWMVPNGMKIDDVSLEENGGLTTHKKEPLRLVPIKYNC